MEVLEGKDAYLSTFAQLEKSGQTNGRARLQRLRTTGIDRFAALGFPTLRDEEWKFTNIGPLARIAFQPAAPGSLASSAEDLRRLSFGSEQGSLLIFVNGHYDPERSSVRELPEGAFVGSLAQALAKSPSLVEPYLGRHAQIEEQPFTALNTAFIDDGAFVSIPQGKVVSGPIHLVYVSTAKGQPTVSHPRSLFVLGANSQATIVETFLGTQEDVYFTNAVTEVVLAEGAMLDHYKVQRESLKAFHVATMQAHQERSSTLSSHSVVLGGGLVRNDVNAVLDAEGCECTLNGLYLAAGRQHVDNHTRIDHARPRCASHELYKGILDGKAHGVFNGKIYVHQDAQKTDAKQTNKTLLLSDEAVINSKPQLEIFADDVKCTHGATIGQLAEESIFYLRSRGIGRNEARSLLTYAFANDIIGRIKVESIRAGLEGVLLAAHNLPAGRQTLEGL
jgi:Fe-S cluster assembly protein SufD